MSDSPAAPAAAPLSEPARAEVFRRALLAWHDVNARRLPWRAEPGQPSDPWRVLVSEIMLQQTTVATVMSRFEPFLKRYPTPAALAEAPEEEVLHAWAGLGYYSRARRLRETAQVLARSAEPPQTASQWRRLPGVGDYTSAAVASICFGEPALAYDTNLARVLARLAAEPRPADDSAAQAKLRALGRDLLDWKRPADFNQAMMDLGATICVPRRPRCEACPVETFCEARRLGLETAIPAPKKSASAAKAKLHRRDLALFATRPSPSGGEVFLWRRSRASVYGGMWELPTWRLGATDLSAFRPAPEDASLALRWLREELQESADALTPLGGPQTGLRHGITVYKVQLDVLRLQFAASHPLLSPRANEPFPLSLASGSGEGRWTPLASASEIAQATPHKKLLERLRAEG